MFRRFFGAFVFRPRLTRLLCNFFTITFFVAIPTALAQASVEITEIMYDLEGTDSGLEWVEIYNNSDESVDITNWRFVEADTNHTLTSVSGNGILDPGEYGIIVSEASTDLFGEVFDSSFSLSNTGERIGLRDGSLNDVDMVTYTSEWGAAGDGLSLQKIDGVWKASAPTKRAVNVASSVAEVSTPVVTGTATAHSSTVSSGPQAQALQSSTPKMVVNAGVKERVVLAGASSIFDGKASFTAGDNLASAVYSWNFGDGTISSGQQAEHIYQYPGEYAVSLNVVYGSYTGTDRVKVIVVPADIQVSSTGDEKDFFVEISNNTKYEVELSGWKLQSDDTVFIFPKGTFIFPNKKIRISHVATGFVKSEDWILLLFPNGEVVGGDVVQKNDTSVLSPIVQKKAQQDLVESNFSMQKGVVYNEAGDVTSPASLIMGTENRVGEIALLDDTATTEEEREEDVSERASVLGAVSGGQGKNNLFWGLVGVSLLVLIALYAVLGSRKVAVNTVGVKSEADLYKIIEIDN